MPAGIVDHTAALAVGPQDSLAGLLFDAEPSPPSTLSARRARHAFDEYRARPDSGAGRSCLRGCRRSPSSVTPLLRSAGAPGQRQLSALRPTAVVCCPLSWMGGWMLPAGRRSSVRIGYLANSQASMTAPTPGSRGFRVPREHRQVIQRFDRPEPAGRHQSAEQLLVHRAGRHRRCTACRLWPRPSGADGLVWLYGESYGGRTRAIPSPPCGLKRWTARWRRYSAPRIQRGSQPGSGRRCHHRRTSYQTPISPPRREAARVPTGGSRGRLRPRMASYPQPRGPLSSGA